MNHKFFFPLNYDYSSKFLGIIEYKLLTPISIYGILLFLIIKSINIDFFTQAGIFIILYFPPLVASFPASTLFKYTYPALCTFIVTSVSSSSSKSSS